MPLLEAPEAAQREFSPTTANASDDGGGDGDDASNSGKQPLLPWDHAPCYRLSLILGPAQAQCL